MQSFFKQEGQDFLKSKKKKKRKKGSKTELLSENKLGGQFYSK